MKRFKVVSPEGFRVEFDGNLEFELRHETHELNTVEVYEMDEDWEMAVGAKWSYTLSDEHLAKQGVIVFHPDWVWLEAADVVFGYELLALPAWVVFSGGHTQPEPDYYTVYTVGKFERLLDHSVPGKNAPEILAGVEKLKQDYPEWWVHTPNTVDANVDDDEGHLFNAQMSKLLQGMFVGD